ncbi:cytoplasmic protein [Infundibulicybe gibba]|nr:cytoplasmic protein [Infundibulicybe gibba]
MDPQATAPLERDPSQQEHLFTCLSCSIAFLSAEEQRTHYRSDHHRYNMKRRVASLPPVSAATFNQKVLDRRTETAIMSSVHGSACEICGKIYTTENAYRSHINSKKHRDNELKAAANPRPPHRIKEASTHTDTVPSAEASTTAPPISDPITDLETTAASLSLSHTTTPNVTVAGGDKSDELTQSIDAKIAAARSRLSPTHCLFCPLTFSALPENLTHMSQIHSFFIPDADYLIDLPGLIAYLGEKIAVGNVCIFCNDRGREFRTIEAVRKHMSDKAHCKIAYASADEKLEISDFYDFTSSYPDAEPPRKKAQRTPEEAEEWEELSDDEDREVDEIVDEDASDSEVDSDLDSLPDTQITYGDSHLELVLPSGHRIGHRSMRRYYAQSFPGAPRGGKPEDPNSGAALVRRLLADKNSALVPRKGGFGAYGSGTDVVKARNRGEAREAGRHKRREDFKTGLGYP